jgi:hypothetical protein
MVINNVGIGGNGGQAIETINMRDRLIKEVAYATLQEFGISLIFAIPAAIFASTAGGAALVITSVVMMVLFNATLRGAHRYYQYLEHQEGPNSHVDALFYLRHAEAMLCPLTFSIVAYCTGGILFHEAGHAFAALSVLKNPNISIAIVPFSRGNTSFNIHELTKFGAALGTNGSHLWIGAAGAGASVALSVTALVLAWKYRNDQDLKTQERVRYLKAIAITNLLQHVFYALSGLSASKSDLGHDFVLLWVKGGIHPMLSAFLIALPLLILLAGYVHTQYTAHIEERRRRQGHLPPPPPVVNNNHRFPGEGRSLAPATSSCIDRLRNWYRNRRRRGDNTASVANIPSQETVRNAREAWLTRVPRNPSSSTRASTTVSLV